MSSPQPKDSKIKPTCLSIDCPERFSLCCGAGCTNGNKGESHFVCSKCRKEFVGGECTAGEKNYMKIETCPHCGTYCTGKSAFCTPPIPSLPQPPKIDSEKGGEEWKYSEHDHSHCWESKKPPCGQRIKHFECCLCQKLNPKISRLLQKERENWKTAILYNVEDSDVIERILKAKEALNDK